MRFELLEGPYDGATGTANWTIHPEVIWVWPGGRGPNGLMLSTQPAGGRCPYERVADGSIVKYQYAGGSSGLPLVDERELEYA